MAAAFNANPADAPLGVSVPGVPPADPVEDVSAFERTVAQNLRQPSQCGRDWIRRLLDDPAPESEAALAKLVADSGGRGLRENIASLKAQLQAAAKDNNRLRRAVESAASNAHIAPAQYPAELRATLTNALGRPYRP